MYHKQVSLTSSDFLGTINCIWIIKKDLVEAMDNNKNIYVTDIATNPHITKGMSFYYAFSENDLNYTQMLETLISLSLIRSGHSLR